MDGIIGIVKSIIFESNDSIYKVIRIETDNNDIGETESISGVITEIASAVKDGNTIYYILVDGTIYTANISVSHILPFLKVGDAITFDANADNIVASIEKSNWNGLTRWI